MDNKTFFDKMCNEAKTDISNRSTKLIKVVIDLVFDFLEEKIKDLPETIKQLRNNPETEQKIAALWSEYLCKEGLVPAGYNGLPDNLLISNLHQEGYLDGLYIGYILSMMALSENNVPNDIIISTRDYIRQNSIGLCYDDRDEIISRYKSDKYIWIEKIDKAD